MLVEERDQGPAKRLVRRVDQLLARVLMLLDGDGLADQRDDIGSARQGQARGAPQEAQRGACFPRESSGAREGQELSSPEVVDGDEI